ncbi:MAG TPA: hypothetical protein EYP09_04785 [Anaerolineae bacterium]|nr:hypothetical protein [Anaerolineae bacterium]
MKVYRLTEMAAGDVKALKRRSLLDIKRVLPAVEPIVEDVRVRGDAASGLRWFPLRLAYVADPLGGCGRRLTL